MKPGTYTDRHDFEKAVVSGGYRLRKKLSTPKGNVLVCEKYMEISDDPDVDSPCWKVAWFVERDEKIMIGRVLSMPAWHSPNGVWSQQKAPDRIAAAQADALGFIGLYEGAGHG